MPPTEAAPTVDARILNDFLKEPAAERIRKLHTYLAENTTQFTELLNCVPVVAQAAQLYGTGDYVNAFDMAYQAYRSLALLRIRNTGLPSLSGI